MLKMSHRPPPIPSAMVHSRGGGGGGDEGGGGGGERRGGGREGKEGEDLNQSGQSALASSLNLSTADIPQVQVIASWARFDVFLYFKTIFVKYRYSLAKHFRKISREKK